MITYDHTLLFNAMLVLYLCYQSTFQSNRQLYQLPFHNFPPDTYVYYLHSAPSALNIASSALL